MKHYTDDQVAKYLNTYVVPQDLKISRMILSGQLDKNGEAMVYIRLRRYDPATGKDIKEKRIRTNCVFLRFRTLSPVLTGHSVLP